MDLKRSFVQEGEEGESSIHGSKRRRTLPNAVRQVRTGQSRECLLLKLEPFLRALVREEVETVVNRYVHSVPRLPTNLIQATGTRRYQLHFKNKLPHTLYTGSKILAEGGGPLQIVIIDTNSKKDVRHGSFSLIKIDIHVLDGDFGGDELEHWTEKEFNDNVVCEREGKRPLLVGDLVITLSGGISYLGDVTFTDNSSWIRSQKFRLGARVSQSIGTEGNVQEAISEAFRVKDHRVEFNKKHHPPSLDDEVWRLEKIGRDGARHRRLGNSGINTVQDFLRSLVMDQCRLRSLLGNGMTSNKSWEATLEHARECVPDEKRYSYCVAGQGVVPVFNCIFQLVGASYDGHVYHPLDSLTASQKVLVDKLKQLAYTNPNDIDEFNGPLVGTLPRQEPIVDLTSIPGSSLLDPQILNLPATCQAERTTQVGFKHLPYAPWACDELSGNLSQLEDISTLPTERQVNLPMRDVASIPGSILFDPQIPNLPGTCQDEPATQVCHKDLPNAPCYELSEDISTLLDSHPVQPFASFKSNSFNIKDYLDESQFMTGEYRMGYGPGVDLWDHGNGLFQGCETSSSCSFHLPGLGVHISSSSKWVNLMAPLKFVMSIRKLGRRKGQDCASGLLSTTVM